MVLSLSLSKRVSCLTLCGVCYVAHTICKAANTTNNLKCTHIDKLSFGSLTCWPNVTAPNKTGISTAISRMKANSVKAFLKAQGYKLTRF
jgi:hypothetical protein